MNKKNCEHLGLNQLLEHENSKTLKPIVKIKKVNRKYFEENIENPDKNYTFDTKEQMLIDICNNEMFS